MRSLGQHFHLHLEFCGENGIAGSKGRNPIKFKNIALKVEVWVAVLDSHRTSVSTVGDRLAGKTQLVKTKTNKAKQKQNNKCPLQEAKGENMRQK